MERFNQTNSISEINMIDKETLPFYLIRFFLKIGFQLAVSLVLVKTILETVTPYLNFLKESSVLDTDFIKSFLFEIFLALFIWFTVFYLTKAEIKKRKIIFEKMTIQGIFWILHPILTIIFSVLALTAGSFLLKLF